MKRFAILTIVIGLLAGVLLPLRTAVAAPPPAFSVSPTSLALTAPIGGFGYGFVTVTTGQRPITIQNPATFATGTDLFDTQAGTCWQLYGALGSLIPRMTSCTIQIGFNPAAAGTFTDTMSVTQCLTFHVSGGQIVCDSTDGSIPVALTGTATLPDLIVDSITIGPVTGFPSEATYTVTVKNQGTAEADLTGVVVQGYYSEDTTIGALDSAACGNTMSGTLAPGATVDFVVGCSAVPAEGQNYLLVEVDISNELTEANETNNVGSIAVALTGTVTLPDLIVESITISPVEGFPPEATYTVTVKNQGTTAADLTGVAVQGYYSEDTTIGGPDDSGACGNTMSGTLAAGATVDFVVGCSAVPAEGQNYLLVEVDISNALTEENETNNVGSKALPLP